MTDFLVVYALTKTSALEKDEKNVVAEPVVIQKAHVKNVSKIGQRTAFEKQILLTPVVGRCAVNLITAETLIVDHSFEEMVQLLGAISIKDLPKAGELTN